MMCERSLCRATPTGSLLAEKQTVQNWIADSRAEMHAARLMTLQAAWKMDRGGCSRARVEIAMIKYYGAQVLYNVIDRSLQVHGSLGYSTDLPSRRCTDGRARRASTTDPTRCRIAGAAERERTSLALEDLHVPGLADTGQERPGEDRIDANRGAVGPSETDGDRVEPSFGGGVGNRVGSRVE
jgi:hypothetical protein